MRSLCRLCSCWFLLMLAATLGLLPIPQVVAHPMGNFAICHYTRLEAGDGKLRVRYILDFAEIPTVSEKARLDVDRDGTIRDEEKTAYLAARAPELLAGLRLTIHDQPVTLRMVGNSITLPPGAGGLDTLRIVLDLEAPLPNAELPAAVHYRDGNYEARAGWKEIVVTAASGRRLRQSSAPTTDRSRELTAYPEDVVPPQDIEAAFTVAADLHAPTATTEATDLGAATPRGSRTPHDAFTEAVAYHDLGIGMMLAGLGIAFAFGALHALAPGHGKAMVAAYLVGARGTARHAAFLGLVVTITHTLGVFLLGLVTLFAAQYVLPDTLYPILEAVSGLAVCGVGVWLLYRRVRRWLRGPRPVSAARTGHAHHHDIPEGPITLRSLLALGISGGLVPCPSALVVLLAAVALHRIGYGLLLITAFSFGLASVLIVIGLLVVYARAWLEQFPQSGGLLRRLPVASAVVITLIGGALVFRALEQLRL